MVNRNPKGLFFVNKSRAEVNILNANEQNIF